jgi:hypothetical protein
VLIFFSVTIFSGAALLFLVQPMFARMVLPLLGGSPAVWNTAMVFYQAVLLAGYAYAHFTTRWLGVRRQAAWHLVVLLAPLLVLPIGLPHGWTPPTGTNPAWWLLAVLAVSVGLPFFVVSASSPLLQRWFSASGHRWAADPYFLYAASNLGSLLALVSYPVLVEPRLRLAEQNRWWAVGYAGFVVLTAMCGIWIRRVGRKGRDPEAEATRDDGVRITARRRFRWVLLAFVPCSLMLSVTTYVTSEIVPIPLLWVIPLGIYLLTFILVFARRRWVPHVWWVRGMPFAVLPLVMMLVMTLAAVSFRALVWPIILHFAGLFVVAMFCHGELANDRPPARHLTEFYLWMSAGGVLGGMFNALLAPLVFPTVLEYPLTLLLACLLMPRRGSDSPSRRAQVLDVVLPVVLGLVTAGFILYLLAAQLGNARLTQALIFGVPPMLCLSFSRRPLRFTLGIVSILVATTLAFHPGIPALHVARSFFGILRVEIIPGPNPGHILRHGTTGHGVQSLDPRYRREPLAYFTRTGPLGQMMAALPNEAKQRVAVVGLGAGTLACYAEAGQQWTFYEIDPAVERIARDPRYFTYLQDCPAAVTVVLGDARLSLQAAADGQFGLMVLDAYSSDMPPLHLITREALALYVRKLRPSGVLAFNITNRHLDLESVLANLARDAGLFALCRRDSAATEDFNRTGKLSSTWVIMARDPAMLGNLVYDTRWQQPQPRVQTRLWTDDYASVFSVWSWR